MNYVNSYCFNRTINIHKYYIPCFINVITERLVKLSNELRNYFITEMAPLCSSTVGGRDASSYRICIRPCEDLRSWLWPECLWLWDTAGSGIKVTGRRGVAGSAAPVGRVPLGNAAAAHHHHLLPLHSTHVRCPRARQLLASSLYDEATTILCDESGADRPRATIWSASGPTLPAVPHVQVSLLQYGTLIVHRPDVLIVGRVITKRMTIKLQ